MKPILLIQEGELRSSVNVQRHVAVIREALPEIEFTPWKAEPPNLKNRTVVKVGNSPFLGGATFNKLRARLSECRRAFVLVDDYTYPPASQVRQGIAGKDNVLMSNCPSLLKDRGHLKSWAWAKRLHYINWNMASWKLEPFANPTHDGLFYFGIFRDDRVKDFDKYLECGEYTVNVSARSSKALLKFTDRYYISGVTGVLDFPEFKQFKLSLYLEDSRTHTQYHSLANRFFECLGLGIAQVFDSGCTNTLRMAGIYDDAKPWIVDSPNDIARLLPKWRSIRTAQRELWVKDYRAELVRSVRKMFRSEGLIDLLT